MSVTVSLEALLDYSDHERRKWQEWLRADPSRLGIPFQPGGRFPNLAALLDHVFFVERRHLSRLEGGALPESSGVPAGDMAALFDYADLVRSDFRAFIRNEDDPAAARAVVFTGLRSVPGGTLAMTRRRLATHIILHEIRHFAQMAHAARAAGHEPPGDHDLLFFGDFA